MPRFTVRLTTAVALLVATACGADGGGGRELATLDGVHAEPLPIEPQHFLGVDWVSTDEAVLTYLPSPDEVEPVVGRLTLSSGRLSEVKLPSRSPRCDFLRYFGATALSSRELQIMRGCNDSQDVTKDRLELLIYDLPSGSTAMLADLGRDFRFVGFPSWDPRVSRGITSVTNQICSTLYWVDREGLHPLRVEVTDRGRTFQVGPELFGMKGGDCAALPRADQPAWSPDGREIAFWFSSPKPGVVGQARLDLPWSLHVMDPKTGHTRQLLTGVRGPGLPWWSPNGRWIAFSGSVDGSGSGTWLLSRDSLKLVRLTDSLSAFAWSPNGQAFLSAEDVPGANAWPPLRRLMLFDLPPSVG